jgi:transposase
MEREDGGVIGFRDGNGSSIMKLPDEVSEILALSRLGMGSKAISKKLEMSRTTVKRYLRAGGWVDYKKPERAGVLDGHGEWLREQMQRHGNNAEVVRQELQTEKKLSVSLRTVERAVQAHRAFLRAEAQATTRFETNPGEQAQIDFGERFVPIAGERVKVYFFVLTLGYSRRNYVRAFMNERLESWLAGMEGAFRHFGGVTEVVLLDNPKPLVTSHDVKTREVVFSERFKAFAKHWNFTPRACAPYRARTKGKDERGVGYVKRNAIAGREFASWSDLEAHLERWMREIADLRVHGTTEERPIDRFERERAALRPIGGKPSFVQVREFRRVVHTDLCVELDTNSYSVPWRYIGHEVTVRVRDGVVSVLHAGAEIARHSESPGRRQRVIDNRHYFGLTLPGVPEVRTGELSRSLDEYAAAAEA